MNKKILIILLIILSIALLICLGFQYYIHNISNNKYILAYVPYKYIEFNNDEIELKKGECFTFTNHNLDINEIGSNIKFNIENEEIIEYKNGLTIEATSVGETSLKITTAEGNEIKSINVKVKQIPTQIEVNKEYFVVQKNETKQIKVNVLPTNLENKNVIFLSSNENIATVDENGNIKGVSSGEAVIRIETVETPSITKQINIKVINVETKDNGATYVDDILLVNKKYTLPATYSPGVDKTAKKKFDQMKKAALKDNISLTIVSGYRSYNTQAAIYNKNVEAHGAKIANRFSAKAGQSEHQTGLAFDVNKANRSFVGTKEALWLQKNCYKYGFIIRYPKGKESITGYVYEPWHIRYVGEKAAKEIYESGLCLEEYLGVN